MNSIDVRPLHEPERRTPIRLDGNCSTTSRIGVRRSDPVHGPDLPPKLEVEAAHEPERRVPARPVEAQRVQAERELGVSIAVQRFKAQINSSDALPQADLETAPGRRIARHLPLWIGLAFVGFTLGAQFAVRWQIPFPQCMLRKFTGIPCPTCGCTRSLLAWSNLDLPAAFRFNPLFFLLCLGFVAWFGLWCVEWLTGGAWLDRWGARVRRGPTWKIFIALAVVNWLYLWLRLPR